MGVSAQLNATEYDELTRKVRDVVASNLPSGTTIAVVSRGDEKLVRFADRSGWHFPQNKSGRYAGFYPADSAEAISHLEELRAKGAHYFLIPSPALWWLDYYTELKEHLDANYPEVVHEEDTCLIFQLDEDAAAGGSRGRFERSKAGPTAQLSDLLSTLVPRDSVVAVVNLGESPVQLHGLERRDFPGHGLPGGVSPAAYLESVRRAGAEFVVIPHSAFGWLDTQPELKGKLAQERFVTRQKHVCELYELRPPEDVEHSTGAPTSAGADASREQRAGGRWTKFLSRITGKAS
jgi:hypothetical protein